MYYGSYTGIHIVKSRIAKWDRVCGIAGYIAVNTTFLRVSEVKLTME